MLRRNILLLHNAALGDFTLTWPLPMALGRTAAQSRVFYVTAGEKGHLAQKAIGVESSDIESGWHHLHGDVSKIDGEAKKLLAAALTIISFEQQPVEKLATNLAVASGGAKVISVSPNPPPGRHVWEHQASQFDAFPPIGQYLRQMQEVVRQRGLTSKPPANPNRIVIHPGSGATVKNWPLEQFIDVAHRLKSAGREVCFSIGEVEVERFKPAEIAALRSVGDVRVSESLTVLFDLLESAGGYIGNDSGPTHLAAMIGRPTIALFGPASDAECWSPCGPNVVVLPFDSNAAEVARALVR